MNPRRRRHQRTRRNYRKLFARKVAEGYFRRGVAMNMVITWERLPMSPETLCAILNV